METGAVKASSVTHALYAFVAATFWIILHTFVNRLWELTLYTAAIEREQADRTANKSKSPYNGKT